MSEHEKPFSMHISFSKKDELAIKTLAHFNNRTPYQEVKENLRIGTWYSREMLRKKQGLSSESPPKENVSQEIKMGEPIDFSGFTWGKDMQVFIPQPKERRKLPTKRNVSRRGSL